MDKLRFNSFMETHKFHLKSQKTETILPFSLKQGFSRQYRRGELVVGEVYIRIQKILFCPLRLSVCFGTRAGHWKDSKNI